MANPANTVPSAATQAASAVQSVEGAVQTVAAKDAAHAGNWVSHHILATLGIVAGLVGFLALLAFLAVHH